MTTTINQTKSDPRYLPVDKAFAPDWILFVLTLLLVSFGVVLVYDASYAIAESQDWTGNDPMYYLKRQALFAVVGLIFMGIVSKIPYWKLAKFADAGMILTMAMLIYVHFAGHGAQGAERWIKIGPVQLQPSEFAKVFLILYLAKCLALRPRIAQQPLTAGIWSLVLVPVATILAVEKEPDLGTAITLFGAALLMLFTGGVKKRWIAAALAGAFMAGLFLSLAKGTDNYRWKRIETFMNPDADVKGAGWQVKRGTIALGTGGALGLGLGESREKFPGNLPAQRTDFVFAILGEEFGFVGTTLTITLLFGLIARGYHIAGRSKDPFGSLLATGITSIIAVQTFENIAVVTGVIPATGIPLPFLSYGGSSLVATLGSIGVLLNISQHPFRRDPRDMARELRRVADESEARASASVPTPGASSWRSPVSGRHGMIVGPEVRN
ncbi:MAG: putative lipid II flippase FtsW [Akkermansiaceae bacterium]|nr:putative lipid II flippase FtsW [Armatimonadota bacterium]